MNWQKAEQQLAVFTSCTSVLRSASPYAHVGSFAIARASHLATESFVDLGIQLIDALHLRDPGGYEDIVHILAEAEILPSSLVEPLVKQVQWRHRLVRAYATLTQEEIAEQAFPAALCIELHTLLHAVIERLRQGEYV